MGYTLSQSRTARAPVITGDEQLAANVSSTNTVVAVEMSGPCKQVSVQASGTLVFTWAVSLNGTTWTTVGSVSSGSIGNYNTTNVSDVQITWTSGSGNVSIIGT